MAFGAFGRRLPWSPGGKVPLRPRRGSHVLTSALAWPSYIVRGETGNGMPDGRRGAMAMAMPLLLDGRTNRPIRPVCRRLAAQGPRAKVGCSIVVK